MFSRRGIAHHKSALTRDELARLRTDLTVEPVAGTNEYGPPVRYKVFSESVNYIFVPRFFEHTEPDNRIAGGVPLSCPFTGILNSSTNQIEASECVYNGLKKSGGGLLSLPTGYGKTTVALHIICRMATKTLVVVHKEFLLNQWAERIAQFVPSARIGRIQGDLIDTQDKDIVIGMLQSLSMKSYDSSIFNEFGLTVIDETHHVCAKTFSRFLMKYNTRYILGLSATLERKDGLSHVLNWFMGDVLYKTERKGKDNVEIIKKSFTCDTYDDPFPTNRMNKINLSEGINQLTKIDERNTLIIEIVKQCLQENRRVLILTDRRKHCELLKECMDTHLLSSGLYIGGMKQEELKVSETCDVIMGTYSLANEGLDIPHLDTLILATPKSDVIQSVGRILRETIGKVNEPRVYDIVDTWGCFNAQYYKRCKYYKESGFRVICAKGKNKQTEYVDVPIVFLEDD